MCGRPGLLHIFPLSIDALVLCRQCAFAGEEALPLTLPDVVFLARCWRKVKRPICVRGLCDAESLLNICMTQSRENCSSRVALQNELKALMPMNIDPQRNGRHVTFGFYARKFSRPTVAYIHGVDDGATRLPHFACRPPTARLTICSRRIGLSSGASIAQPRQ